MHPSFWFIDLDQVQASYLRLATPRPSGESVSGGLLVKPVYPFPEFS
jgi:hypothetical protein